MTLEEREMSSGPPSPEVRTASLFEYVFVPSAGRQTERGGC